MNRFNTSAALKEIQLEPHKAHRVLVLQNSSLFENYGGVQYYVDDLLNFAVEAYGADNVHTLMPQTKEKLNPLRRSYHSHFVSFSKSPFVQKIENRYSKRYYRKALELIDTMQATILIVSHVSLGPMARKLSKARRIPYITIVHGTECWGNLWPQDEWCLRRASGIISSSNFTKKILSDRGIRPHLISVVQPRLAKPFEKLRAPRKRTRKTCTLLTVSRLDAHDQYKGQDDVLRALAKLKVASKKALPLRYIIQGDGTDKARLEALAQDLNLHSIVEFRPAVKNRTDLDDIYREADIFIMPSRFGKWGGAWRGEGFGIVYIEAAAFGLPCIAYRAGGATEIIHHGISGMLVEPDNIGALADTILLLSKDRKLMGEMGKKAYEYVMNKFTHDEIEEQFYAALDKF